MGQVVCWREDMAMFFFVCIYLGGWKTILYHIKRKKEVGEKRNSSVALMFISRTSPRSGKHRLALEA
jgi:hypothetical protein